jgi:hypothetical protein
MAVGGSFIVTMETQVPVLPLGSVAVMVMAFWPTLAQVNVAVLRAKVDIPHSSVDPASTWAVVIVIV